MAERIEACFDNALYLRDLIRDTEGFRLVVEEPECTNVCFWYIPKRLRGQQETEAWWNEIAKVRLFKAKICTLIKSITVTGVAKTRHLSC